MGEQDHPRAGGQGTERLPIGKGAERRVLRQIEGQGVREIEQGLFRELRRGSLNPSDARGSLWGSQPDHRPAVRLAEIKEGGRGVQRLPCEARELRGGTEVEVRRSAVRSSLKQHGLQRLNAEIRQIRGERCAGYHHEKNCLQQTER